MLCREDILSLLNIESMLFEIQFFINLANDWNNELK